MLNEHSYIYTHPHYLTFSRLKRTQLQVSFAGSRLFSYVLSHHIQSRCRNDFRPKLAGRMRRDLDTSPHRAECAIRHRVREDLPRPLNKWEVVRMGLEEQCTLGRHSRRSKGAPCETVCQVRRAENGPRKVEAAEVVAVWLPWVQISSRSKTTGQ